MGSLLLGNEDQQNAYDAMSGYTPDNSNPNQALDTDTGQMVNYNANTGEGPYPIANGMSGGGNAQPSGMSSLMGGQSMPQSPSPMQGNVMGMMGLLMAGGVPFNRAIAQASGMVQQQGIHSMQQMKMAMAMQKYQQQQQAAQGQNDLLNSLLNDGQDPSQMGMQNPSMAPQQDPSQAATLGDMNAMSDPSTSDVTDPSSPNNLYTQMDDPNAVPSPMGGMSLGGTGKMAGTGAGKLDERTKNMARLMIKAGDKKGAVKLLMAAQNSTLPGGFMKNPLMGPSRGGQGGTYTNPTTGQVISSDTNKQTSQDQATVASIQRLEPMMNTIINTVPQFQRADTQLKSWAQGKANTYLGGNYELPSIKATGDAAIKAAPDALLKVLGLPSTDKGLDTVLGIIKPQDGESPQYYKQRAINQLLEFKNDYSGAAKDRLRQGIDVSATPRATYSGITESNINQAQPQTNAPQQPMSAGATQNLQQQLYNFAIAEKAKRSQSRQSR